jgi:hypothetical protein
MIRGWVVGAFVGFLGLSVLDRSTGAVRGQEMSPTVSVSGVARKKDDEHYYLRFTIKNTGSKPITIFETSVPWRVPGGATMILAEAKTGKALKQLAFPIDEPVPLRVEIKPGEEISGERSISDLFDLGSALKSGDVDVFWSYQLRTVEGRQSKRVGGWLLLSTNK